MRPASILAMEKIPKIGQRTIEKILSMSPLANPSNPSELIEMFKMANAKFNRIPVPNNHDATIGWKKALEILEISQQHNIKIISGNGPYYPKYLSRISNPPALLHVLGNINALNKDCIAIIGTRKPTNFGIAAARKFGALFAEMGYVVVSGLAEGIDSAAHLGALDANGETVAVLAHGLDSIYPSKNKGLADKIIENNGALVSEYPWGTGINRSYFVARDRIQSGLSLGVFVIETDVKGGTMHTVKFCEDQNRTLIVLQHPFEFLDQSKTLGNAHLIKEERASVVFENDEDIDLVKIELNRVKDKLSSYQVKNNNHSPRIQSTLDIGVV